MNKNEKSLARLAAIQASYSNNIDEQQNILDILELTIKEIREEHGKVKRSFAKKLLDTSIENRDELENIINKNSDKLEKSQKNILVNSILEIALSELMLDEKLDRKIILSEYVNLTSEFFNNRETGYVNAVLDKFVKSY